MDVRLLQIYVAEIERQCQFANYAYSQMLATLKKEQQEQVTGPSPKDASLLGTLPVFYHAHSFLTHAALVSQIMWPKKNQPRQGILDAFDIPAHLSFKTEKRALRNHLEHYDERIETWYLTSPRRNMMDMCLMPRGALPWLDEKDFRRNLDPQTLTFYFEGDEFPLPEVARELDILQQIASRWLLDHPWHSER